ncbi:tetratricopeptide repeat protein [Rubrivivax gelatinosus]|uniref:TPR repeat protein n=1 Tax=Rubrivivax gelatinosus (strain NBRC 100245 / IL144) TaxID=983917 RepID=I0HP21_RUBGI|nr:tetratricopeptide repeat protein [Rubrivivax gelatinosus]BAL94758.1 TPR repeat protein [Rubrivivax gelatinosus IL144]
MRRTIALLVVATAVLAGCATAPDPGTPPPLWRDEAFAPPEHRPDPAGVFATDERMRAALDTAALWRAEDPRRLLVELLYRRQSLALDYEGATRTAAETFAARSGNCLSLVAMTAAFAREAGLPVRFRSIAVDESWSRSGDLMALSGHVNVGIGWPVAAGQVRRSKESTIVVDFLPGEQIGAYRWREISPATVLAMFMNNRAAEALAQGRLDDAYWHAREAIRQDAHFSAGYNTLAVVYRRRGLADAAETVWRTLLAREPANRSALANLSQLLAHEGRRDEAQVFATRLQSLEVAPPFHWFDAGLDALQAGDPRRAREFFVREVERDASYHEFHYWLARAELLLGRPKQALRELELARETSPTPQVQALYAAKLDRIKAERALQ